MKLVAAYALYYVGDAISHLPQRLFAAWYPFYNWCMNTSVALDTQNKLWNKAK